MQLFFDPIYQASLFGTVLMALSTALIGVFVVLKRRSLVAEALSHATYPGLALGMIVFGSSVSWGALVTVLLALWMLHRMEMRGNVASDPALCFTMDAFWGVGVLLTSYLQSSSPVLAKKMDSYLFGQSATMLTAHVWVYAALALTTVGWIALNFGALKGASFDRSFARLEGVRVGVLEGGMIALMAISIVVGVRCVGVVLMVGMVIAPAVAARCWCRSLGPLLFFAAFFGVTGALIGNLWAFTKAYPPGPVIVCVTGGFALLSLAIHYFMRLSRIVRFGLKCRMENSLKQLWKGRRVESRYLMRYLWLCGLASWQGQLTGIGLKRAEGVVRLHRLWELYLSSNLDVGPGDVHACAEKMEHILTPEMERELTEVLGNPTSDPHAQPIPGAGV